MAFCDPAGARTQDPYIKSVMLYQLSYGIKKLSFKAGANIVSSFYLTKQKFHIHLLTSILKPDTAQKVCFDQRDTGTFSIPDTAPRQDCRPP